MIRYTLYLFLALPRWRMYANAPPSTLKEPLGIDKLNNY